MNKYKIDGDLNTFLRAFFFLAYRAAGGATGMGTFQARSDVTPAQVLDNVRNSGDYPGESQNTDEHIHADYVFGRMLKVGLRVEGDEIIVASGEARPDYQGWARTYPKYEDLVKAAADESGTTLTPVTA